jgi:prepilin-type N-terminal cleavage/methylation domain-containing protein
MNPPRLHPKHSAISPDSGFTLSELMVVIVTLGILAILALPALGNAKGNSRQLSCLNNLRQLGIAAHMYVVEYQQYTGCISANSHIYVWPGRLLGYTGGQRGVFACPAATPTARWDTNLNNTLIPIVFNGKLDFYGININGTRFSYGINDWGLSFTASPQLGLGGDIDVVFSSNPVRDSDVVAPSQMIMLGDTPASTQDSIYYTANLDPTDNTHGDQLPSNRHQYLTDIVFTDGHTETPLRSNVINPVENNPWRSRWNNDNQPHTEYTWTVNTNTVLLDPSY